MRLYGQEAVLDGLVPQLVGLDRTTNRRPHHRRAAPVVHLVGPRGSGKTTLLDDLQNSYRNRVPLVRADLAKEDFGFEGLGRLPGDDLPNASHLTSLLYLISHHLQLAVPGSWTTLKFRRLSLGLLVVTTWPASTPADPNEPADLRNLRQQLDRFRTVITADSVDRKRRNDLLRQLFDALLPLISTVTAMPPGADALAQTVLTTARDALLSPRGDRGALNWWKKRLGDYQGDAVQKLYWFGQTFQQQDHRRNEIEALLTAALIADIDDSHDFKRRLNDTPRPLVLLDNLDALPDDRLIAPLRDAFAHLDADRPGTHPVFVVTTQGSARGLPPLTRDPVPDGTWMTMGLPPVRQREIRAMLGTSLYPAELPLLVDRLSGGRAATACTLLDAFDRVRPAGGRTGGAGSTRALTDQLRSPSDVGTLAGLLRGLVDQFLPDPTLRARVRLLSAALDRGEAVALLTSYRRESDPVDRLEEVQAHLTGIHADPYHWPSYGPGTPFLADRALRTLLLQELRAETTWAGWEQMRRLLRDRYPSPTDGTLRAVEAEAKYLHHTLALGQVAEVANALHRRFLADRPADWLTLLNVACSAPQPPDAQTAPATPPCPTCTAPRAAADSPTVHLAITRLLTALWQQSSPLAATDEDHVNEIAAHLRTLRAESNDPELSLLRARDHWPVRLRQGTQAPDLPIERANA
ncbi:hypothetical protein [Kitasatospora sp. NPDC096204]|uniref:hypothetical protein n=1 Tax=Kitasatospora sp. NPDC096204 TaxID=3364094 RepID=UPI003826C9FF